MYQCEIKDGEAIVSIGDIPIDLEVEIPLRLTVFSGKEMKDWQLRVMSPISRRLGQI